MDIDTWEGGGKTLKDFIVCPFTLLGEGVAVEVLFDLFLSCDHITE